ncbi:MAG TPA: LysE family transporter [Candidatus Limnocylindrales bacterium]|nr:LysE family transporter [Candidatus Limnocylindrales bacterium]
MPETLGLAIRGVVVGFTIAAAVGPISLLTIRRTITHGRGYGLASGLGVATADATYAGIAAFGLTAISNLLVSGRVPLAFIGGGIIVLIGLRTMTQRPSSVTASTDERPGLAAAYASIYALTMTNPLTILAFAAVFTGLGFAIGATTYADAGGLTLGVLVGSSAWWVVLTGVVAWLRGRISTAALAWVNRVSGTALVVFGLVAIVEGVGALGGG